MNVRVKELATELNRLAVEKPSNYLQRREMILAELIAIREARKGLVEQGQ